MKILVTGTRGVPNIQGGVETHCEELYPRIVNLGHEVVVVRRSPYVKDTLEEYKGVKLKNIFAPRMKSIEAIIHTLLSIIYAKKIKADVVHVHAVGPALVIPFARLLGLCVVFTHHGPDYDRQKWNGVAKWILRRGEAFGVKYSNRVIVISKVIENLLSEKYNFNKSILIHNGVNIPEKTTSISYLEELGLEKGQYVFTLGRFVREKGFHLLIEAFRQIDDNKIRLVIAGDADHEDEYSLSLKKAMNENGIIHTGFIKGEKLEQLFTNARLFILPSSHEGLPISLLEAMSYGLNVLVSDIPANKEVGLSAESYFESGNLLDLQQKMNLKIHEKYESYAYDLAKYDWNNIARITSDTYCKPECLSH